MNKITAFITKHWPILIYGLITLVLFAINYRPGTYLTGWDNLHPEFNFALNFARSLSSVWQNHSVGVIMAHTPDFIHQGVLFILSLFLPNSILRYLWMMAMLLIGACGAYKITLYAFSHTKNNDHTLHPFVLPFVAGLFYQLNLAAIQTFYAPFEAYVAHFAFLPWVILTSLKYLKSPSFKTLVLLSTILLLNTTSVYIPTLFVVTTIALAVLCLSYLIQHLSPKRFATVAGYGVIVFLVNAFWMLPFLFYTATHSPITLGSKINQMSTEIIFSQNKEFGDLFSVMSLKGFWFNNVDLNAENDFSYMMGAWRVWINNPFMTIVLILLFSLVLLGVISQVKKLRKNVLVTTFFILFFFSVISLAIVTPPFSFINEFLRENVKILHQAFRFPYTKFAILASLSYAFFLPYGLISLFSFVKGFIAFSKKMQSLDHPVSNLSEIREIAHESDHNTSALLSPKASYTTVGITLFLILIVSIPAFFGHFFYEKNRVIIPTEYFELMKYLNTKDDSIRIANLPQYTFWGWNFYRWGYGGSGFLWYGVKQPILDRAYDVWTKEGENYYFEMTNAIYRKDAAMFNAVLQKYQAGYVLVDKNIINPNSQKSLFIEHIHELIQKNKSIKKEQSFGNIDLYRVTLDTKPSDFVFLTKQLPKVNQYSASDNDIAFQKLGNYQSVHSSDTQYFYPFRELFSKKSQDEVSFTSKEDGSFIDFQSTILAHSSPRSLFIPSTLREEFVPTTIYLQKNDDGSMSVNAGVVSPQVSLNGEKIYGQAVTLELFILPPETQYPLTLDINSVVKFTVDHTQKELGTTFLSVTEDNHFTLSNNNLSLTVPQTVTAVTLQALFSLDSKTITIQPSSVDQTISVRVPKVTDEYLSFTFYPQNVTAASCDRFREGRLGLNVNEQHNGALHTLFSQNSTTCSIFYSPNLPHELGYIMFLNTQNINGKPFHLWVLNEDEQIAPLATFMPKNRDLTRSTYILPPMEEFGKAYSFHLENISIGSERVENAFAGGSVYAIPYRFLTTMVLYDKALTIQQEPSSRFTVQSPTDSYYLIDSLDKGDATTLVLSQTYEPYWKAYVIEKKGIFSTLFPFTGKEITDHVRVNNWENGWNIHTLSGSSIALIYLPVYLEYLGIIITVLFICILLARSIMIKVRS